MDSRANLRRIVIIRSNTNCFRSTMTRTDCAERIDQMT